MLFSVGKVPTAGGILPSGYVSRAGIFFNIRDECRRLSPEWRQLVSEKVVPCTCLVFQRFTTIAQLAWCRMVRLSLRHKKSRLHERSMTRDSCAERLSRVNRGVSAGLTFSARGRSHRTYDNHRLSGHRRRRYRSQCRSQPQTNVSRHTSHCDRERSFLWSSC